MSQITFEEIMKFKIGDIIYECEYGMNIEAMIISAPILGVGFEDRRTLDWKARNTKNDTIINYFLTEGFDHYGPYLYHEPQYIKIKPDGTSYFPFLGDKKEQIE